MQNNLLIEILCCHFNWWAFCGCRVKRFWQNVFSLFLKEYFFYFFKKNKKIYPTFALNGTSRNYKNSKLELMLSLNNQVCVSRPKICCNHKSSMK